MKPGLVFGKLLFSIFFLALAPAVLATTWYVDGAKGNDDNNCKSPMQACKTIGHAISLAHSGDSVKVASATYTENLSISISLKILGSGANSTVIVGGTNGTVVTILAADAHVTLAKLHIQHGSASSNGGGGIYNNAALAINNSIISD
jgi:hypothetical protein